MAKGTFKRVSATLNRNMSDIRVAFGRTAADIAKSMLEDLIKQHVPEDQRGAVLGKVGDAWRTVVRHVYKAVARVMRDKLAEGKLTILPNGKFDIKKEELQPYLGLLPDDFKSTLKKSYNIVVT